MRCLVRAEMSDASLRARDTVETDKFTVVGRIAPESFKVETPFGPLTVALKDIRYAARDSLKKPEVRTRLTVTVTSSTPTAFLSLIGIRTMSVTAHAQAVLVGSITGGGT